MQDFEFKTRLTQAKQFYERLTPMLFDARQELVTEYVRTDEPIAFSQLDQTLLRPIQRGDTWGKAWDNAWFRFQAVIPEAWAGKSLALRINLGGEVLLRAADGTPLCGLTNASVFAEYDKTIYRIPSPACGGARLEYYGDAVAHNMYGVELNPRLEHGSQTASFDTTVRFMDVGIFNEELWQLLLDYEVLLSLVESAKEQHYPSRMILRALCDAIALFKNHAKNAGTARRRLREILDIPSNYPITAYATGHGHIDTGWLWTVRDGRRKCIRTFANQLDLMERYPEYIFGASQAQHYAFIKHDYPKIFEKIKARVKEGRWELQGGMWVEADANLTSGESLIRQFIHGKNFFMDEFGVEVKNLWLPDVFGYSGALPQIIKKARCNTFLTQKISWNTVNRFPHHTFLWRGIDGSEVLTHFPPENTYCSLLLPDKLNAGMQNFTENDWLPEYLILYGIGDGGGGPCDAFVEHGRRVRSLLNCPQVQFSRSDDFFERLHRHYDKLPVWCGELYLENHRGTLTSQARTKKNNRKLEYALRQVEAVYASLALEHYPTEALDRLWKILLLNQFHDILPGSSIRQVYEDTEQEHLQALNDCQQLLERAGLIALDEADDSAVYLNLLSEDYKRPLTLPQGWRAATLDGQKLPMQHEGDTTVVAASIPALGAITLKRCDHAQAASFPMPETLVLENELIRYEFDANACIIRAYDKCAGREIIRKGNNFTLYDDHPNTYDAWDIDRSYMDLRLENAVGSAFEWSANGAVRKGLRFMLTIGNSTLVQQIYLALDSRRLDFETVVDWHEEHKMLRVEFPAAIYSETASYDIQYGYIKRPTHSNTSWDTERFEVVAHRYADLSEADYGVALLNDCKYGHRIYDHTIDLALLRSPKYPDSEADIGSQSFSYSLLPHLGSLVDSEVIAEAAALNLPPVVWINRTGRFDLPCTMHGTGVELSVLKKAEKSNDLIIRLVEIQGRNNHCEIGFPNPVMVTETDLLEWESVREYGRNTRFAFSLVPFEIKTLKISAK